MEPTKSTDHPFGKENDLPNLHEDNVPAVNLQGVYLLFLHSDRRHDGLAHVSDNPHDPQNPES